MATKELPLISVLICTYNSSKFILSTLESVYAQTYAGPIELLIGDDCSADNTATICREWIVQHAERFTRAEVIQHPENLGVTENHDVLVKLSKGEWVKFIGGDDILMPHALDVFYSRAKEDESRAFLYSSLRIFQTEDQLQNPEQCPLQMGGPGNKHVDINDIFRKPTFWTNAPTFFMSRKVLDTTGGYAPVMFRNIEDRPLFAKMIANGYCPYHLAEPTVFYRTHAASLTSAMAGVRFAECNWRTYREILRPCFDCLRRWDLDLRMLPQWYLSKQGGKSKKVSMFKLGCKLLWFIYRTLTFAFTLWPTRAPRNQKGIS